MDSEFEDFVYENNTDELDNFVYHPSIWDYIEDSAAMSFTFLGVLANIVIIYMIARNVRMRSKTNIILMHFVINDLLFLICNLGFLSALFELLRGVHFSPYYNCFLHFTDMGFQFNECLSVLFLISNTLMKSKRIQVKWLVCVMYTFTLINIFMHMIQCYYHIFPVFEFLLFLLIMFDFGLVVFKEFNNCYKKWYKKDPLSPRTQFRLNIGRIYVGSWLTTFLLYLFSRTFLHNFVFIMSHHSLMTSMYILIYIVYADKNFQICFLNMLHCKGAGDYDVDATITFAEDDSNDGRMENNQVNINFNNAERVP